MDAVKYLQSHGPGNNSALVTEKQVINNDEMGSVFPIGTYVCMLKRD